MREEQRFGDLKVIENPEPRFGQGPDFLSKEAAGPAHRILQSLPDFRETDLVSLSDAAAELGIKMLAVKDESTRFGLKAFKGLGGLYAMTRAVCDELGLDVDKISFTDLQAPAYADKIQEMVFVTATDGNHGKGVSWAAGKLGCEAHVYMPVGSSKVRAQAIRDVNPRAEVRIMEVGYDDAVRYAAAQAQEHGWHLIQDTSWEGYETVPMWITQGYTQMVEEACRQLEDQNLSPTHVFVQAGVGAMAGSVVGYLANRFGKKRPLITVVEPETMACIYRSAAVGDGKAHAAVDQGDTIMAGLNCGEPCELTWPVLRDFSDFYMTCPDFVTEEGMRFLAKPVGRDRAVVSGESGAVTTGIAVRICGDFGLAELKKRLGIGPDSVILCFSTEGDTDPEHYRMVIENDLEKEFEKS